MSISKTGIEKYIECCSNYSFTMFSIKKSLKKTLQAFLYMLNLFIA